MQQNFVLKQPYFGYALLDSLDAIVRDRLSSNASSSSKNGIFKEIATFRKVSKVGDISPLNHLDQLLSSTPVAVFKSLYERFKNFSLFLDSQAYIVFITILSCVSLSTNSCVTILTNIAQTAKRLLQQALTAINHLPVRSGYFKRKHHEYNKNVGTVCTPSSCIVPFKQKGGAVMQISHLSKIQTGREGWIYLIHAEGTSRYKIGRSVNPIGRASDIQKQAPYPLKIVRSAWTLDTVADERNIHEVYANHRIFGEWFEFTRDQLEDVQDYLGFPPTMHTLAWESIRYLAQYSRVESLYHKSPYNPNIQVKISSLYRSLKNRQEVDLVEVFIRELLPTLVTKSYLADWQDSSKSEVSLERLAFMAGAIDTFAAVVFNQRLR